MSEAISSILFHAQQVARSTRRVAWRGFWALGAVAHIPAVLGLFAADWSGGDGVIRALLLVIGLAFCLLKVLDWAPLRTSPGWRSRLVCVLALGLLHVGLIPQLEREAADFCLTTTTGVSALVVLSHCAVDRGGTPDRPRARRDERWLAPYPWSGGNDLFTLIAQRTGLSSSGPRSPPFPT